MNTNHFDLIDIDANLMSFYISVVPLNASLETSNGNRTVFAHVKHNRNYQFENIEIIIASHLNIK